MTELDPIDAVRARPGMYVGNIEDGSGVLNVLLEVLANALDQHLAGRCSRVAIEIAADGTIAIADDGPGFAADGADGLPPLDELLTRLSRRPTVDGHRPHIHLGCGGMGLCVVNALSERFELRTIRAGVRTTASYARGRLVEPVTSAPANEPSGTRIRFKPDAQVFTHARVPRVELARRLEDLSFLAPRFAVSWAIAGDHLATGGLAARVALGVPCDIADVVAHAGTYETASGPVDVAVALAWRTSEYARASIDSFVNLERTPEHGSHVDGLRDGVRAFFGDHAEAWLAKLVAAVSVVLADVKYGSPTKDRLASPAVREPVAQATRASLASMSLTSRRA